MAKMDAIKEKIAGAQAAASDKLDKIALFKKWKERRAQKNTGAAAGPDLSLGNIYRQGGTTTRLQVIFVYIFALAALFYTVQAGRKMIGRMARTEDTKLKKEYSHGLGDMATRAVEKANLVSMGKFTTNAYNGDKKPKLMAVDIWLRVSDPTTAEFVQKNDAIINDGIVNGFNRALEEEANPLSEEGNIALKSIIAESVNKALPKGHVEEVFFQNLMLQ